jgi:DDE family transposase
MVETAAARTRIAARGRHVLALQDTSEINYQAKAGRKQELGPVGNGTDLGLFVHPVLALDAETRECLGLADLQVWRRAPTKVAARRTRPIEAKESFRWLKGAAAAQQRLSGAWLITVVGDGESDIFEHWARTPDARVEVLARAAQDRALVGGGLLFATLSGFAEAARYTLALPARPRRPAHTATLAVRFGEVVLQRPSTLKKAGPAEVVLRAIEVREIDPPAGVEAVHWRLLTTHAVATAAEAQQIVEWYCARWTIEQLFRTLKRQGLGLEDSLIEDGAALERLATLAVIAATTTMQLVQARSSTALGPPASRVFAADQIPVLVALQDRLEGRTAKQRNPHPPRTLAWAAWIIARLGGWTGYASERPPGPITMRNGLNRFAAIHQGYSLAKDVCAR